MIGRMRTVLRLVVYQDRGMHRPARWWTKGSPYNYGIGKPHYSVPTVSQSYKIHLFATCVICFDPNYIWWRDT